jgi:hypothetical protein
MALRRRRALMDAFEQTALPQEQRTLRSTPPHARCRPM